MTIPIPHINLQQVTVMVSMCCLIVGVDVRAAALFRMVIGAAVTVDLLMRLTACEAHYGDRGVAPRWETIEDASFLEFSLFFANGRAGFAAALLIINAAAAVAFAVGYRSRAAAFVCWLFSVSLASRNLRIGNGGDKFVRAMLLWSTFLPTGQVWSVDASHRNRKLRQRRRATDFYSKSTNSVANVHVSVASFAVLAQNFLMYFVSAVGKLTGPEWTTTFDATYYALSVPQWQTASGKWLLQRAYESPALRLFDAMRVLTAVTLVTELLLVFLIFSPWRTAACRTFVFVMLAQMHVGIFMTCRVVGMFPVFSIGGALLLLPPPVMDWLETNVYVRVVAMRSWRVTRVAATALVCIKSALRHVVSSDDDNDHNDNDDDDMRLADRNGAEDDTNDGLSGDEARSDSASVRRKAKPADGLRKRRLVKPVEKAKPSSSTQSLEKDAKVPRRRVRRWWWLALKLENAICLPFFAFAVHCALSHMDWVRPPPPAVQRWVHYLQYQQSWTMFDNGIATYGGFYVAPAVLRGEAAETDLMRVFDLRHHIKRNRDSGGVDGGSGGGGSSDGDKVDDGRDSDTVALPPVSFAHPLDYRADLSFTGYNRWLEYTNWSKAWRRPAAQSWAAFMCREWNLIHPHHLRLEMLQIFYVRRLAMPPPDREQGDAPHDGVNVFADVDNRAWYDQPVWLISHMCNDHEPDV
jgi:hypothetical protein